jgi:glycosyltransferase involved in cell wall biosynthesis
VDSTLFQPDRPGRQEVRRALGWRPDDLVVSYVSRIAPEKNVSYLSDALAIVAARRPDVRILFVGDGPSRNDLEQRLGTVARFAGYRTGEDLADHYAAGDIFAFSSRTETFGNVVLEAMASGMPVVASRAGGVGDTVQSGTTGLLVEPGDSPAQFAAAVLSLVDQAELRRKMSRAARAFAQSQSWDAIMGDLRLRYQVAVDAGARAAEPAGVS